MKNYVKFNCGVHKYYFIEIQLCSFIYVLSSFHAAKAETLWPKKPKIFIH